MPLHPHIRAQVAHLERLGPDVAPDEFAAALKRYEQDPEPWSRPAVEVVDDRVPGPNGPVDVRLYAPGRTATGMITWIHGGAFMTGDLDMPEADMVAAELAVRTGAAVVSVGYRLAVDGVHHPVPLQDCDAAWRWACERFAPDAPRAVLGGASAGATLAVGCALLDRDGDRGRVADSLILVYPFLHHPVPAPTFETAEDYAAELPVPLRFGPDFLDHVVRNYIGRIFDVPVDAVPGHADLRGLPPASIVVAEYDDLRPSGELFARQLADAGVDARLRVATGMPHGYLNRSLYLDEVRRTIDLLAEAAVPQHVPPAGDHVSPAAR